MRRSKAERETLLKQSIETLRLGPRDDDVDSHDLECSNVGDDVLRAGLYHLLPGALQAFGGPTWHFYGLVYAAFDPEHWEHLGEAAARYCEQQILDDDISIKETIRHHGQILEPYSSAVARLGCYLFFSDQRQRAARIWSKASNSGAVDQGIVELCIAIALDDAERMDSATTLLRCLNRRAMDERAAAGSAAVEGDGGRKLPVDDLAASAVGWEWSDEIGDLPEAHAERVDERHQESRMDGCNDARRKFLKASVEAVRRQPQNGSQCFTIVCEALDERMYDVAFEALRSFSRINSSFCRAVDFIFSPKHWDHIDDATVEYCEGCILSASDCRGHEYTGEHRIDDRSRSLAYIGCYRFFTKNPNRAVELWNAASQPEDVYGRVADVCAELAKRKPTQLRVATALMEYLGTRAPGEQVSELAWPDEVTRDAPEESYYAAGRDSALPFGAGDREGAPSYKTAPGDADTQDSVAPPIERLELFEERYSITLEALSLRVEGPDSNGDFAARVRGEVHARPGRTLERHFCIAATAYDGRGRVIGHALSDKFYAGSFPGFGTFSVDLWWLRARPARVRLYPQGSKHL